MALRLLEGFENRRTTFWLDQLYESRTGSVASAGGRTGGRAASSSNLLLRTKPLVASDENTWVVGFALRKETIANVSDESAGIALRNDGGVQCRLHLIAGNSAGSFKLELRRDTTVLATSTQSFLPGGHLAWHYFMLKVTVRTGANGAFELRHFDRLGNQTVVFSGSGVNLAHQAVDGANRLDLRWSCGSALRIDDVFAMDATGSTNNDFPAKPLVVRGALPAGDGNRSEWRTSSGSDHFALVDDSPDANDSPDYVQSSDTGEVDLFTFAALDAIGASHTVVGVQVVTNAGMLSSGSQNVQVRVRSGGNEAAGSAFAVDQIALDGFATVFDQNPTGTPAPWSKATLEAAEFGVEVG